MIDNDYRLPSYMSAGDSIVIPGLKKHEIPVAVKTLADGDGLDDMASGLKVGGAVPVADAKDGSGWIETPEADGPPGVGRYPVLAMDCEMVRNLLCSDESWVYH